MDEARVFLKVLRGSTEGADCESCPFGTCGLPTKPVVAIGAEEPAFIVIGEGPGRFEVVRNEPFVGPSGQVVNQILARVGRTRGEVWLTNATLCIPPQGTPEPIRQLAAKACKPRLVEELSRYPGKPILTLGAVAARSVIPQETLDAIEPPDAPKAIRKAQKLRQQPVLKNAIARRKAINKISERRLKKMIKHHRKALITEAKVKHRARPDEPWLQHEVARVQAKLELKAREDAIKEYEVKLKEREIKKKTAAAKPKKRKAKQVKITDICGTLFDVDVDGSGVRPLIPGIHPAALLRGGGASIGGSHTPDMAFVNLVYDALKINSLAKGKDIRLKLDVAFELFDQQRATELFLDLYHDALEEGAMSIDLETYVDDPDRHSALMSYVAKIRVIGFATKKRTISLDWDLLPSWCMSLLQLLLIKIETTYHNGLYDRSVLRRYGFLLGDRWFDTLLAHHAAFPGNAHRLQVVTAQFFGVGAWKSEFRNAEETPEKLAIYNANDTGATHALREPLRAAMTRTKTRQVFDLDLKMSDVASEMHLAGMPVDRDINSELLATFGKNVHESRQHVEEIARDPKLREQIWHHLALQEASKKRKLDPDDFEERYNIRLSAMKLDPDWKWKIGAGKHIAALLQAMGVALHAMTPSGQISTQKEVLESLADVPVVRDILIYRENDKLHSTFVWPMFDRHDPRSGEILSYGFCDEDDRAHPLWSIHKISGRWASSWPVVSNVPKDKWKKVLEAALTILLAKLGDRGVTLPDRKEIVGKMHAFEFEGDRFRLAKLDGSISKCVRPNLRKQIRVRRKGRKLIGFDFGQIEARVIALISGDPFLCAIFAEGRDPHIECARIIWQGFDKLDEDTRKQLRENVKNIEYGAMYMAQLETLHKTMLKAGNMIRIEDLAVAINKLLKAMAGVVAWQHRTIAQASQPPYEIKDHVLGRRRVWPLGQAEGPEAVNYGVQTTAAAIMNQGMARMYPKLLEYHEADPIAQIHDAAVFECWEDDVEAIGRDIKDSFETEIERDGRRIPFPVDIKVGDSWDQL